MTPGWDLNSLPVARYLGQGSRVLNRKKVNEEEKMFIQVPFTIYFFLRLNHDRVEDNALPND